jgi:hypothetical protein
MSDKVRPIAERIAEMMGKTAYRDIRDGVAEGFRPSFPDVAANLGAIQRERGETAVQALETYYGSTLMHEHSLRHAWDAHCRRTEPDIDYETSVLARMGCALAIRQLAGLEYGSSELREYAWIIRVRQETLKVSVLLAEDWLDELWGNVLRDLREAYRMKAA